MIKRGVAMITPLITLRNSLEPIFLFSGIAYLYFSIDLPAILNDFRKKDRGEIRYLKQLKLKIFLFRNKPKKKNNK
jgi:hypothetical protein